jgi:hypothetical protein
MDGWMDGWMESQNMLRILRKWFCSCMCALFAEACKRRKRGCAPTREECNKYDMTAAPCF